MTSAEAIKILCDVVLKRKQHSRPVIREAVMLVDNTPTVKATVKKGKANASDA